MHYNVYTDIDNFMDWLVAILIVDDDDVLEIINRNETRSVKEEIRKWEK